MQASDAGLNSTPSQSQATSTGTIGGLILARGTGFPIHGATVQLFDGTNIRYAVSDNAGRYEFRRVPAGPILVVARALDRTPLSSRAWLTSGTDLRLDLRLVLRPFPIEGVVAMVSGQRLSIPGLTPEEARATSWTERTAMESSPGAAELGLVEVTAPADPTDPAAVLYVRGAANDLKLVLLDGAPVYAPFHLGGLLDAFPGGLLESSALHTGGTPARYDGGLSYVLELNVREGSRERPSGRTELDMLGSTVRAETSLGDHARVIGSGRILHGLGYPYITDGVDLAYGYGDALVRLDADIVGGHLSGTGFWNRESILLEEDVAQSGLFGRAHWGNTAGSASWRMAVGEGGLSLTAAYGLFVTQLPLPNSKTALTTTRVPSSQARLERTRTEAIYESGGDELRWAAGAGFDTQRSSVTQLWPISSGPLHEARSRVSAAWGEVIWRAHESVELRGGLRGSYFARAGYGRAAPRLAATWKVAPSASVKLSAGRFFQTLRGPESILSGNLNTATDVPVVDDPGSDDGTSQLAVAAATHLVVGLENRLESGVEIGLEGYFKSFTGVPGARSVSSSGADLWVHASEGPLTGWVGYSLAWVWSELGDGERSFVGRHLLTGGISADARGWEVGAQVSYGAGIPFVSVNEAAPSPGVKHFSFDELSAPPLSGAPSDSYLRIDAELARRWDTGGDQGITLAPYLKLLNSLDRRDALFYSTGFDERARPESLAGIPIVAVLGLGIWF